MEKKMLSLGSDGKLIVKSADGREQVIPSGPVAFQIGLAIVYLLIDCSSSMCGEKIRQVKQGTLDFAKTAFRKGYRVGLISFDASAALICEHTRNISLIADRIKEIRSTGNTNLTDALKIVSQRLLKRPGYRVAVIATDGYPDNPHSALKVAEGMKRDKIEILAISTEDADKDFLGKLVSRKDLNLKVERNEFRRVMETIAQRLPVQFLEDKR